MVKLILIIFLWFAASGTAHGNDSQSGEKGTHHAALAAHTLDVVSLVNSELEVPVVLNAAEMQTVRSDTHDDLLAEERSQSDEQLTGDDSEAGSDLVMFFGRFHPFLVHLPIGFLLFAILLEFVSLIRRFQYLNQAVPFALLMGFLSGIAAGTTGYMLSLSGGYSEDLLNSHKWLGIGLVLLAAVALILRVRCYEHPVWRKAFRILMFVMAGWIVTAGHYGGSLTHGSDYLFRYMPEPMKSWFDVDIEVEEQIALLEDLDSALVYEDIIHPIIRTRCQSCHNYDRTEADLLLLSFDHLMRGGENGPVVVRHNARESELYRRLILPDRDDDRMPPRGRRQLTHDQIKLIEWWIDQGVPSTQTVAELEIDDEIFSLLNKLTVAGQSFYARTQVPPADPAYLDSLRTQGIRAIAISETENFLQVQFSASRSTVTEEDIKMLETIRDQLTWLDLNRKEVSEQVLKSLAVFHHLTRLNLSNTSAGDQTLEQLGRLENLEYLNLYATRVGDEGLQYLESLNNLKSLYLWQTNVSESAIEELRELRPDLYINVGYQLGMGE